MLADKLTDFLENAETMLMLGGFFISALGLGILFSTHHRKANRKAVLASRLLGVALLIGGIAFAIWAKMTSLTI